MFEHIVIRRKMMTEKNDLVDVNSEHGIREIRYGDLSPPVYRIGSGMFGRIYGAQYQNRRVVYKIMKHAIHRSMFFNEVKILSQLQHKCIPAFYGFAIDPSNHIFVIVMEKARGMSLFDLLSFHDTSTSDLLGLARDILGTLSYIHSQKILFRDLKPENIIVSVPSFHHWIVDFGLAKEISEDVQVRDTVGTPGYMAPEVLLEESYSYPADIYSFGMTLYSMMTKRNPGRPNTMRYHLDRLRSSSIRRVILDCIHRDPLARPDTRLLLLDLHAIHDSIPTRSWRNLFTWCLSFWAVSDCS